MSLPWTPAVSFSPSTKVFPKATIPKRGPLMAKSKRATLFLGPVEGEGNNRIGKAVVILCEPMSNQNVSNVSTHGGINA